MADSLFGGLPAETGKQTAGIEKGITSEGEDKPRVPASILVTSKKPKDDSKPDQEGSRRVKFKTSEDLSVDQVISALDKIISHIGNPSKFSKAAKLAVQLFEAEKIKAVHIDKVFLLLSKSMENPGSASLPNLRSDYKNLFNSALPTIKWLSAPQKSSFEVWRIFAVLANDLVTDDSYEFSRACKNVKQEIEKTLMITLEKDHNNLELQAEKLNKCNQEIHVTSKDFNIVEEQEIFPKSDVGTQQDPFGLNKLLPEVRKEDGNKRKSEGGMDTEEEGLIPLSQIEEFRREAVIHCIQVAVDSYKKKWAQTAIDILVKFAFDNRLRFTLEQRQKIEELWYSLKNKQIKRQQTKSDGSKLDVTSFERLQEKYSREEMSIRKGVGSGGRSSVNWLG